MMQRILVPQPPFGAAISPEVNFWNTMLTAAQCCCTMGPTAGGHEVSIISSRMTVQRPGAPAQGETKLQSIKIILAEGVSRMSSIGRVPGFAVLLSSSAELPAAEGDATAASGAASEIVVTATKREEKLQEVPISVTVVVRIRRGGRSQRHLLGTDSTE